MQDAFFKLIMHQKSFWSWVLLQTALVELTMLCQTPYMAWKEDTSPILLFLTPSPSWFLALPARWLTVQYCRCLFYKLSTGLWCVECIVCLLYWFRNMRRRSMRVSLARNLSCCYNTWISFCRPSTLSATLASTWLESAKCRWILLWSSVSIFLHLLTHYRLKLCGIFSAMMLLVGHRKSRLAHTKSYSDILRSLLLCTDS